MNRKTLRSAKEEKVLQEQRFASRATALQCVLTIAGVFVCSVLLNIGGMVAALYAQSYPNKPIRLIVPYPPQGPTALLARLIGDKLAERLGQPVVPDFRPGAGGNVGIEFAAKTPPDGYNIVLVSSSYAISPSLYKKLNFDPFKDLTAISLVAQIQNLLIIRPSLPVKNLKEFVEYAKANPGKLNFGSGGIGGPAHLASELLKSLSKINIVHVPYKGATLAQVGLMGGEIDLLVLGIPTARPQVQAGKVRALAVLSSERAPSLPNVPTAKEAGIENFEVSGWFGILTPAGTPRDIVNRLNAEWVKIVAMPDTVQKMQNAGFDPLSGTPQEFSEFIRAEITRWAKVIKEANVSVD